MSEYVSQVLLTVNGQSIEDFDTFEEKEIDRAKAVNLMNKTGSCKVTPRYGCSVDYVCPKDAPEFDFNTVDGGTLTIDKMNGVRITYTGVCTAKIGSQKYDGENPAKRTIDFICEDREEE